MEIMIEQIEPMKTMALRHLSGTKHIWIQILMIIMKDSHIFIQCQFLLNQLQENYNDQHSLVPIIFYRLIFITQNRIFAQSQILFSFFAEIHKQNKREQNTIKVSHLIFYNMGICSSEEKTKPKNTRNQPKQTSHVIAQSNPSSALKQESKIATKITEVNKLDSKVIPSNIKSNQNEEITALKTEENKMSNPPQSKNSETGPTPDKKFGQEFVRKRQGSGSWLRTSDKVNEEIPEDLIAKVFKHVVQQSKNVRDSSPARRTHHEGVTPIIQQANSESEEFSQRGLKKKSIKQEIGVQPLVRVCGFSWESKVGEVNLIC